jgi:hypothetical protein
MKIVTNHITYEFSFKYYSKNKKNCKPLLIVLPLTLQNMRLKIKINHTLASTYCKLLLEHKLLLVLGDFQNLDEQSHFLMNCIFQNHDDFEIYYLI